MSNKFWVVIVIVSFAVGRYSLPEKVVTKTVEVDRIHADTDKDKHKEVTVTETVQPDGGKTIVTTTVEDTKTKKTVDRLETTNTSKETVYAKSKTQLQALFGISDVFGGSRAPVYGGLVSRNVLGPVTAGAWALTNGTAGVTIGLSF